MKFTGLQKTTWKLRNSKKAWSFEKNMEFLPCEVEKFEFDKKKSIVQIRIFVIFINNPAKNTFKVALQYLFNVYILFNSVSYFKLKINQKMCTLKNLEKIWRKMAALSLFVQNFIKINFRILYSVV